MKANQGNLELFKSFAPESKQTPMRQTDKAVIYDRVSSRDQMDGGSLAMQRKHEEEFASRRGLQIMAHFGSTHESAKTDDRKEFNRMLAYVKRNKSVSYIIVYNYDRFSRTGVSGMAISEDLMRKYGVTTLSVSQPLDPTTVNGFFQQNMFYLWARYNNDDRRKKSMDGMIEKIEDGYWCWKAPLGYTNLNLGQKADQHVLMVNEKGKLLRQAFLWKAQENMPSTLIRKKLRDRGLKLSDQTLSKIFRNPFYCGIITSTVLPGQVFVGKHEPLIDRETFLRINNVMNEKGCGYKVDPYNDNLPLRVFVKCDSCGTSMTGYLVKKKGIYYYKCGKKGCCNNRNAKAVKVMFQEILKQYQLEDKYKDLIGLQMEKLFYSFNQEGIKEQEQLKSRVSEIKGNLEGIEEKFVLGQITQPMYEKWTGKYTQELKEISHELDNCSVSASNLKECVNYVVNLSSNLLTMWDKADAIGKNKIQNLVFPEGMRYNRKSDVLLTGRVNSFFSVIPSITEFYTKEGEQKKHPEDAFSPLAAPAGIEPTSKV